LVKSTQNHQLYALKSIVKDLVIEQREITHTLTEREILATLADVHHPNLARLHLAFQDIHRLHLVTDYYCGGDLATQMSTCMTFSKRRTLFYAAEMIEGIGELHRLGILYRDLKPENILLTKQGHVVLTDFGLSKWLVDTDHTDTFCGTAEYLAPELLTGEPYSFGIDHWSYGTILYEMLAGITPFWADNHMEMYRRILEDPLDFPAQDENGLPEIDYDTADFLAGLLDRDPRTRLGAQGVDEIKAHAYFAGISWDDVYHQRLPPAYVPILSSHTDFANFDASFLEMDPILTPVGSQVNLTQDMQDVFEGYSFANTDLCPSLPASDALVPTDLHPSPIFQPARKRGSVSMLSDVDSFQLESPLLIQEDERTIKRRNTHDDNAVGGDQATEDKSMETMDLSKKMTMTTSDSSYTDDVLQPDMYFLDTPSTHQEQQQQKSPGLDQLDFGNGDLDLRFSIQVNEKQPGFAANRTSSTKNKNKKKHAARRLLSPFIRF
jgi:serine/threonine protein kinase